MRLRRLFAFFFFFFFSSLLSYSPVTPTLNFSQYQCFLTGLKIAVQSVLDLLLHQSHTSSHASSSESLASRHLCRRLAASGEEIPPQTRWKAPWKEKMKSLARPPLLLSFTFIRRQSHRRRVGWRRDYTAPKNLHGVNREGERRKRKGLFITR